MSKAVTKGYSKCIKDGDRVVIFCDTDPMHFKALVLYMPEIPGEAAQVELENGNIMALNLNSPWFRYMIKETGGKDDLQ